MRIRAYASGVAVLAGAMGLSWSFGPVVHGRAPNTWRCDVDLHQGDAGTLEFALTGTAIAGTMVIDRSGTSMESKVDGTWVGETISFRRTLSPSTSMQPFLGVALPAEIGQVKMAGRFAAAFAGVWSADCTGDPGSTTPGTGTGGPDTGTPAGPALTTRPNPYKPTARDRVTFMADASHSSGVLDVTISVNGVAVQTCPTAHCEFVGGPYPAGVVRWRVSARARNGGINEGVERPLTIAGAPTTGSCSIAGSATGPAAEAAAVFEVELFGPNDNRTFRTRQPFNGSQYRFDNLADGKYLVVIDTRADISVRPVPARREVVCQGAAITDMNVEFR